MPNVSGPKANGPRTGGTPKVAAWPKVSVHYKAMAPVARSNTQIYKPRRNQDIGEFTLESTINKQLDIMDELPVRYLVPLWMPRAVTVHYLILPVPIKLTSKRRSRILNNNKIVNSAEDCSLLGQRLVRLGP